MSLLESGESIVLLDNFSNAELDAVSCIKNITSTDFPVYVTDILFDSGLKKLFS